MTEKRIRSLYAQKRLQDAINEPAKNRKMHPNIIPRSYRIRRFHAMKNKILRGEHPIWQPFVVQPDYDHVRPELAGRTTFEKFAANLGYGHVYKSVVQQLRRRAGRIDNRGREIPMETVRGRIREQPSGLPDPWSVGGLPRAAVMLARLVNNDDLLAGIVDGTRINPPFLDLSGLDLLL